MSDEIKEFIENTLEETVSKIINNTNEWSGYTIDTYGVVMKPWIK